MDGIKIEHDGGEAGVEGGKDFVECGVVKG